SGKRTPARGKSTPRSGSGTEAADMVVILSASAPRGPWGDQPGPWAPRSARLRRRGGPGQRRLHPAGERHRHGLDLGRSAPPRGGDGAVDERVEGEAALVPGGRAEDLPPGAGRALLQGHGKAHGRAGVGDRKG